MTFLDGDGLTDPSAAATTAEADIAQRHADANAALREIRDWLPSPSDQSDLVDGDLLQWDAATSRLTRLDGGTYATSDEVDALALGGTYAGEWDSGTAYSGGDIVEHDGSTWAAGQATSAGEEPGVSAKWQVVIDGANYAIIVGGRGSTTDTELQAAITDAADGTTLILAPGTTWDLDAQVSWSGKALHIDARGATINENTALSGAMVKATNADGSQWIGGTFTGAETDATFDGLDSDRSAIEFVTSDAVTVEGVVVSGKSFGVRLSTCTRSRVAGLAVTGFLSAHTSGANYHSGCRVVSGSDIVIEGVAAENIGSAVLVMTTPERVAILGGSGTNCFDNGIYISSGDHCTVSGFVANTGGTAGGSGVKARGSGHTVQGCSISGFDVGVTVSGYGDTADAQGANGAGTSVVGNTIVDCTTDGVNLGAVESMYCRHVTIAGNTIREFATDGSASAGIRGTANFPLIVGNVIENNGGTTSSILLAGTGTTARILGAVVSQNVLDTCPVDGIRLSACDQASVSGNTGVDITGSLVRFFDVDGATVVGNDGGDATTAVVRTDSDCSNVAVTGNRGTLSLDAASLYGVPIFMEDGSTSAPSLRFASDLDTGFYRTTADDIGVVTGGARLARLRTSELMLESGKRLRHGGTSGPTDHSGSGDPEGSVAAGVGSTFRRTDGGAGTSFYVKESGTGNTGWAAK